MNPMNPYFNWDKVPYTLPHKTPITCKCGHQGTVNCGSRHYCEVVKAMLWNPRGIWMYDDGSNPPRPVWPEDGGSVRAAPVRYSWDFSWVKRG